MELGFTGTRKGMSSEQIITVRGLLIALRPDKVNHGMCIGADKDFDDICVGLGIWRRGWPGVDAWGQCPTRAQCSPNEVRAEYRYKQRDRYIVVYGTGGLIATPKGFHEEMRGSGTWLTIRIARNLGIPRFIVFPDGKLSDRER